jgi:LacI family transcriptional regulator
MAARLLEIYRSGTQIVSIVSPIDNGGEFHHVGIDNRAAGRTAAYLMTGLNQMRSGKIVLIHYGSGFSDHEDRIAGFKSYLSKLENPVHVLSETICHGGDFHLAALKLEGMLKDDPDIIGIYSASGGNQNLAPIIRKRKSERDLFWIAHEWVPSNQNFLRSGILDIVIDQSPEIQAKRAVDYILSRLGLIESEIDTTPIQFTTITRGCLQD